MLLFASEAYSINSIAGTPEEAIDEVGRFCASRD